MKKITFWLAIVLVALFLCGCGKTSPHGSFLAEFDVETNYYNIDNAGDCAIVKDTVVYFERQGNLLTLYAENKNQRAKIANSLEKTGLISQVYCQGNEIYYCCVDDGVTNIYSYDLATEKSVKRFITEENLLTFAVMDGTLIYMKMNGTIREWENNSLCSLDAQNRRTVLCDNMTSFGIENGEVRFLSEENGVYTLYAADLKNNTNSEISSFSAPHYESLYAVLSDQYVVFYNTERITGRKSSFYIYRRSNGSLEQSLDCYPRQMALTESCAFYVDDDSQKLIRHSLLTGDKMVIKENFSDTIYVSSDDLIYTLGEREIAEIQFDKDGKFETKILYRK